MASQFWDQETDAAERNKILRLDLEQVTVDTVGSSRSYPLGLGVDPLGLEIRAEYRALWRRRPSFVHPAVCLLVSARDLIGPDGPLELHPRLAGDPLNDPGVSRIHAHAATAHPQTESARAEERDCAIVGLREAGEERWGVSKPRFGVWARPEIGSGSIGGCSSPSPISRSPRSCGCLPDAGAASSPKTSNCSCYDISSSCSADNSRALRSERPIVRSSRRLPGCFQVGGDS